VDRSRFAFDGTKSPEVGDSSGGRVPEPYTEHVAGTPIKPPRKDDLDRQAREPGKPVGNVTVVHPPKTPDRTAHAPLKEIKKPKKAPQANDVYAGPDGKVYREREGNWQTLERRKKVSPRSSSPPKPYSPPKPTRSALDRDRKARSRGEALEKKSKPKSPLKRSKAGSSESQSKKPAPAQPKRPAPKRPESGPSPRSSRSAGKR